MFYHRDTESTKELLGVLRASVVKPQIINSPFSGVLGVLIRSMGNRIVFDLKFLDIPQAPTG